MNELEEIEKEIGFKSPKSYLKVIELNLLDYDYWFLMSNKNIIARKEELKIRYPKRNLIPFAGRYDCDDIACFELDCDYKVFIVHDFSSEGWERRQEFDSFWEWFINAMKEMIELNKD